MTHSVTIAPLEIRSFVADDTEAVVALWRDCGLTRPWNDPYLDIDRKATVRPEWFPVGTIAAVVRATAMVGYDGHREWINDLAVDPGLRRAGHARALMAEAERLLVAAGCPKLNRQLRRSNAESPGFYETLGHVDDDATGPGKRLIVDERRDAAPTRAPWSTR